MSAHKQDIEGLRAEIAAAAARMIAEDGADYSSAKRKAARQILGVAHSDALPDNAQVEEEVRLYNELFLSETQPRRLLHLRRLARQLMQELQEFNPWLSGAVWNGTAGEHSDIHLQLFYDNAKDVEIFLLNKNVPFEVSEGAHFKAHKMEAVENIHFMWQGEVVTLALYMEDDLRGALKPRDGKAQRGNLAALDALLAQDGAQGAA
ncbi:hypothetical protein V8J88_21160 [Massilia sp. W12]|uniref:hypothetical protein n=1 Tax=Massilia sp. W12 TaxID=3126507 RepID=UPI0030CAB3D7